MGSSQFHVSLRSCYIDEGGEVQGWEATVRDRSDTDLWSGTGTNVDWALLDLVQNMADELESRAPYLPEDYVDLEYRTEKGNDHG